MTDRELGRRLQEVRDTDPELEERAWHVVRNVFHETDIPAPRPRPRHPAALLATAAVAIVAIVLASASQPRDALARWLRDAIGSTPAAPRARPTLARLPGGGRLLVNSPIGPWIVHANGSRRYLGNYTGAGWSPHGLFVVVWRGSELAAVDPLGHPRWALARAGGISVARWSPDGYRIAYIAGRSLRVVAGDSTGDRGLVTGVEPIAPAWRPGVGQAHLLAFVDKRGEIELRATDTGRLLWSVRPAAPPQQLLWAPDGQRLLAVAAREISLYSARGRQLATRPMPTGTTTGAATFARSGSRLALVRHRPAPLADTIMMLTATRGGLSGPGRLLFSAPEHLSALAWSPDGRWLLATSPSADQWIFIHTAPAARLVATSGIASQFQPGARPPLAFPGLAGWQP